MRNIYEKVKSYKENYPGTLAFRLSKHSSVAEKYLKNDENVLYTFCGQVLCNNGSLGTGVVVFTNKRILIAHKGLLFGHKVKSIDFKKFNDATVEKGLIWSKIEIDTLKEEIKILGLTSDGAEEAESALNKALKPESQTSKNEEPRVEIKENSKPKTKTKVVQKERDLSREIASIESLIVTKAKKDAVLRERFRVSTDNTEKRLLREQVISNYEEYKELKATLDMLTGSNNKDVSFKLVRK